MGSRWYPCLRGSGESGSLSSYVETKNRRFMASGLKAAKPTRPSSSQARKAASGSAVSAMVVSAVAVMVVSMTDSLSWAGTPTA